MGYSVHFNYKAETAKHFYATLPMTSTQFSPRAQLYYYELNIPLIFKEKLNANVTQIAVGFQLRNLYVIEYEALGLLRRHKVFKT